MNKHFNIEMSSNLDYEGMVVNIVYNIRENDKKCSENKVIYKQKTIAVLNQEKGIKNIEIKIYPPKDENYWDFSLDEFLEILQKAKEILIKSNQKKIETL